MLGSEMRDREIEEAAFVMFRLHGKTAVIRAKRKVSTDGYHYTEWGTSIFPNRVYNSISDFTSDIIRSDVRWTEGLKEDAKEDT